MIVIVPDDAEIIRQGVLGEMLENGYSVREIADEVGVSAQTVHYHLAKLGYVYSGTKGWRPAQ